MEVRDTRHSDTKFVQQQAIILTANIASYKSKGFKAPPWTWHIP